MYEIEKATGCCTPWLFLWEFVENMWYETTESFIIMSV